MGKRRNTAKTGDKGIYKARTSSSAAFGDQHQKPVVHDDDDDDPMYDVVDRHHRQREEEFLKLDAQDESDDSEEEKEAVMDLGIGGDDDDDDDESSSSSSDDDDERKPAAAPDEEEEESSEDEDEQDLSDDDDDELELGGEETENVRDWGRKKTAYYHGDTADLELGQDEEDAYLEEEAALQVQAARYEDMSEDDFVLSDDEKDAKATKEEPQQVVVSTTRDMSKLSARDRQKILDKQHPELLPLLSYFSGVVKDLDESTNVATSAIFQGEPGTAESVGMSKPGKRYLLTKALLQTSTALNLAMYLLLKADGGDTDDASTAIQSHPVMARLEKLNSLSKKLQERVEDQVPGLGEQLSNLVQAAALLKSGEMPEDDDDDKSTGSSKSGDKEESGSQREANQQNEDERDAKPAAASSDDDNEASDDDEADEEQRVLNEARFGLRAREISSSAETTSSRKKRRRQPAAASYDVGDDDDLIMGDATATAAQQQKASRALASTLNTIEQKTNSRKRRAAPLADELDDAEDSDGELRAGLAMMEEEYGKDFDQNDNADDKKSKGKTYDVELEDEDDEDDFYAQIAKKSKSRKEFKKSLYTVAPKFPRVEPEVQGERALSQSILKNRGLVPHKNKDNRNPRVKKRKQYRKAVIARKGAVRQVRTDEGHKYGGEETGIKSGISRSRKLARG